jgi:hypothetical protein
MFVRADEVAYAPNKYALLRFKLPPTGKFDRVGVGLVKIDLIV